jgi:hypothetical protein
MCCFYMNPTLFNVFINNLPKVFNSPETDPVIFNGKIINFFSPVC